MAYGIWSDWQIYRPPSADLPGGRNVERDITREVLSAINGLTLLGPADGVIWRGQADADWRLESKMGRFGLTAGEMEHQERAMLRQARQIGADNSQHLGDWEILARLRHHGAATRLIDFTSDPLVALWFLCNDQSPVADQTARQRDGVLLALRRSFVTDVPTPYLRNYGKTLTAAGNLLYRTPPIDPRIAAQRGVFAFAVAPLTRAQCESSELGVGEMPEGWRQHAPTRLARVCDTPKWAGSPGRPIEQFPNIVGIAVPARVKQLILDVLETSYGFTWAAMFPDFAGMGEAYAEPKKVRRHPVRTPATKGRPSP
jgi:hypothetical protein